MDTRQQQSVMRVCRERKITRGIFIKMFIFVSSRADNKMDGVPECGNFLAKHKYIDRVTSDLFFLSSGNKMFTRVNL